MKRIIVSGAVLALAIGGMGVSQAAPKDTGGKPSESGFKVTGGGQIIAEDAQGAGDTVGFNAQEVTGDDKASPGDDNDAARGQFQYVPRGQSAGTTQEATEKFHGVVTCLLSGGEAVANEQGEGDEYEEELTSGMARFGGYVRGTENAAGGPTYFTVDVTDNGQGGGADAQDDLILVRITDAPCADNPEDEEANDPEDLLRLGRGNVKIHNNPDPAPATPASSAAAGAAMVRMAL